VKSIKSNIWIIFLLCNFWACDQPKSEANSTANPGTPFDSSSDSQEKFHTDVISEVSDEMAMGSLETTLVENGLVDIQALDSSILVDLRYSTTNNFVGVDVYGDLERCYLQPKVAQKLIQAQAALEQYKPGYSLLVFDGARPLSVQQIFWDTLAKPEGIKHLYVADPKEGSIHNYGSAVDLTIADAQHIPLDMGTEYDFFGELAYPTKEKELLEAGLLTPAQIENRQLLRDVMISAGFTPINTEWWHFNAYSRKKAAELFEIIP